MFLEFDHSLCRSGLGRDSCVGVSYAAYRGQGRSSYGDVAIFVKHPG